MPFEAPTQPMHALQVEPDAAPTSPMRAAPATFFDDIAGLRGVAVLLVVLFHSHVPYLTGGFVGVDVFFVISGFLITGLLVREYERHERISLRGFFARRARRIIPPAALVIVVSIIGAAIFMPLLKVFKQALDLLAAAAQVANWHFIQQNADYLAGAIDGSLATHFWSLAIEAQLYFIWPFLVIGAGALATRTRLRERLSVRWSVGIAVLVVSVASLVWAIVLTPTDPATAYMATYTRAWQFGVGGLVAIGLPVLTRFGALRVGGPVALVLGWAGLAGIVVAAFIVNAHTPYPGTAALLPTAGAALVIASGCAVGSGSVFVGRMLATPPLKFLGRVSYAWYLWHWPAIVLYEAVVGSSSWPVLLAVSAGSLVLATISTLLFEEPLLHNRELKRNDSASISLGLTGVIAALAVTMTAGVITVQVASRDTVANASLTYQSVFGTDSGEQSGPVTPNPFQAFDDRPQPFECLIPVGDTAPRENCVFGPANGIPVVLFGDSHADQWAESIRNIGADHGWRIHQFTKAACPAQHLRPQSGVPDPYVKADCQEWREETLKRIAEVGPRIIFVSSLSTYVPDRVVAEAAWTHTMIQLRNTGAKLVYIADTPYPGFQVADCISGSMDDWTKCEFNFDDYPRIEPITDAVSRNEYRDVTTLSVNNLLCEGNSCFAAHNKILFYRDDSHLTATAARVLEPALRAQLDKKRFDYNAR
ncbi:acyltransferase [Gordonia amicalis]|uniref:Acyltransferase family protein n=1 Tax=Gordonia amicalis TaxID=89053 RepID=A0AAE4R7Y8_9ACTN|nr:acyltransferase family protein [Gordonia amicalis]MDV6314714.1 acyltransferase family protein [Gordonia amicalis]UPW13451.1 acyltransferase [Gordonia amicalis]